MSDLQVAAMAACAFLGALVPLGLPIAVPVLAVGICYVGRRAVLLALAVALLCSVLAHRSWAGLNTPLEGELNAVATVVTDPVRGTGSTRAVVRVNGTRVLVSAWGGSGARLSRSQAGDRIALVGTYRPYGGSPERRAALHVGTAATVVSVELLGGAELPYGPLYRAANAIRTHLDMGASSLTDERRALFKGLVYGDDRGQSALTEADFRLAGLTHLLAVSGQNVAYVLTLAGPLINRASLRGRWIGTTTLLVLFATITRFEPSVLRATVMAGLAATGHLLGREASGGRLLSLAVTGLLIIDPLLASTIAFRLSVAASMGIAWLRPRLAPLLPGPTWLANTTSVTLSAQLAVAPVLITTFGPISLVSVPANVAAGPVAGAAMTWGMTMGLLAGFLPSPLAAGIHRGTTVLLWALESIARAAGLVPLAPIGLIWIAAAALLVTARRWWSRTGPKRALAGLLAVALLVQLVPNPTRGRVEIGPSSEAWTSQGRTILVLRDDHATTWVLDDLRSHQIRDIDLLVMIDRPRLSQQATTLSRRIPVTEILSMTEATQTFQVGLLKLEITSKGGEIQVE